LRPALDLRTIFDLIDVEAHVTQNGTCTTSSSTKNKCQFENVSESTRTLHPDQVDPRDEIGAASLQPITGIRCISLSSSNMVVFQNGRVVLRVVHVAANGIPATDDLAAHPRCGSRPVNGPSTGVGATSVLHC
jgi:hypothetical protein